MKRLAWSIVLTALCLPLSGCVHAPTFNILGSYFPAWMFCALVGIVFAVLVRLLMIRLKLESYARPTVLTYPCVAGFCTFSLWLLLFN